MLRITALIPAMQIHLYDLRSKSPLLSGLARNRLYLCMLVLSELRDTYWSAGVMYRLFERAQSIIEQRNNKSSNTSSSKISSFPPTGQSGPLNSEANPDAYQDSAQPEQIAMLPTPESNGPNNFSSLPIPTDGSMYLSGIDELLNPGFSLSETSFETLFQDFDANNPGFYDILGPASNDFPIDGMFG